MLPLAREAERLRRAVRLPLGQRPPAAFERAFLDAYRPGETYYLPLVLRQRLAAIGRTGFRGHLEYVTSKDGGTRLRLLPGSSGTRLPGFATLILWVLELGVLLITAFSRYDD